MLTRTIPYKGKNCQTTEQTTPLDIPEVREVLLHRDVVDPGLELRVEKLLPLVSHVKHKGATEEEVFEAKTSCHAAEVEQISRGN